MYGLDGFCAAAKAAEAEYERVDQRLFFRFLSVGKKGEKGRGEEPELLRTEK